MLFAALVLPVSLNGIGVREAVFVSFLHDSTTAEQAIALGVAFFAVGTATSLVGALILALRWVRYGIERGAATHADRRLRRTAGQRIAGYRLPQDDEAPIGQVTPMLHPSIALQESPSHMPPRTTEAQAARPGTMRPVNLLIALFAVACAIALAHGIIA